MTCNLCKGSGSLFCAQRRVGAGTSYEWYDCPACGCAGTRDLFRPAEIRIGIAQSKFCRPEKSPVDSGDSLP